MEYLVMLPGPTNVPDRVMNAMLTHIINHRSDDFRRLYKTIVEKTQRVFQTQNDIVLLTTSGTGAVEASVINMIRKNDKAIIPVNGEFGTRLADLIDSWGGHAIRVTAPFGQNPRIQKSKMLLTATRILKPYMQFTTRRLPEQPCDIWTS